MELSVTIWDYLGQYGTIWDNLVLSGTIWDYDGLSGTMMDYVGLSGIRVQVEAGESKLLLFETFSLFYFFFTGAIPRGARAPKNKYSKFGSVAVL